MTATGRLHAWIIASRPQTWPAGAAPVIVGGGVAYGLDLFAAGPLVGALVGALLIQIGTNFANDYYDAVAGVDDEDREGFTRVTQAGLVPPSQVKVAAFLTFGLAMVVGLYLVYVGGLPILIVGLASIVCGYAYAGGPYPLGSHGLGDLFVFVFFGVIAVTGTVYVQATALLAEPLAMTIPPGTVPIEGVLASLPMAALATNILVINNVRDMETDRRAGKYTLAVLIGYRWSRIEFTAMLVLSYLVPILLWLAVVPGTVQYGWLVLAPLVTVPYAAVIARTVWRQNDGAALNPALEQTGKLLFGFAVLFAVGLATGGALPV